MVGMIGYAAMGEQFHPNDLVKFSKQSEDNGFTALMVSDHFHPWVPSQGHSPFVWSLLGSLGEATKLRFGTGVTPPGYRYHPAILAQAAATLEAMYPGRFYLGLGAGEALNEHIVGTYWPEPVARLEVLAEAIEVIRKLFSGKVVKHRGTYFNLESAKLYTMPEKPPPIYVATSRPGERRAHGANLRRHDHSGRGRREDQDANRALREGRARGRERPCYDAAHHPVACFVGRNATRPRSTRR